MLQQWFSLNLMLLVIALSLFTWNYFINFFYFFMCKAKKMIILPYLTVSLFEYKIHILDTRKQFKGPSLPNKTLKCL